ncbi:hypothetical protein SAMN06295905_0217 [Devosia lucknowensis]|uniref:Uncharacterized protein n=1 Tax=Devosia lucknowensis TaxID=1096929 RepID=A0A1Y6EGU2_9HYPH|nr:hypothetical protein [Devosia lucknowensis]SMQ59353.1 hypothetical protein SAMN06295905_0217 [Devosia lucknowensis]
MTQAAKPLPRTFIIVAFGPLVGAVTMSVIMLALAASQNPDTIFDYLAYGIALYLAFGYIAGFLPALAAALLWRVVPPGWSLGRRVLAAILIGGLTSAILVWPFMALFLAFMPPNIYFAALAAFCGAIALCATALPGGKR